MLEKCLWAYSAFFSIYVPTFGIMSNRAHYFEIMTYINEILSRNDLADYLNIKRSTLSFVLYIQDKEKQYKSFDIPKRNGGSRTILAPQGSLKEIQKRLAKALALYKQTLISEGKALDIYSHGFEKNKSIISNAKPHRNKRYVLNVDLKDFFPSIHFGRVRGFFLRNMYFQMTDEMATVIAQLACFEGKLPQGAPTSPVISNLICESLDYRISKLSRKYKLLYTRYADDLTFSTNRADFLAISYEFMNSLEKCIERAGFHINHEKTRLSYKNSRQEVTGLVINKKVSVKRDYYKKTRAMADRLYKTGQFEINGVNSSINRLDGRFSFINELDRYNNSLKRDRKKTELNGRERDYQRFLFYKYFYDNTHPLLIVEGKTDVVYIKCALKAMHKEYPELVTFYDGRYEYGIRFLKRSNRMKYFFRFEKEGADTFSQIYGQYTIDSCNNGFGCANYFREKYSVIPKNPVIMLFDNEISNKEKPISKFLCNVKTKNRDKVKEDLIQRNFSRLVDNLYVAVCPLDKEQKESEIEDLFDKETLDMIIDGKTFDRHRKKGDMEHYDKTQFADYVLKNYESIDFHGFVPLLNTITNIIDSYEEQKTALYLQE